MTIENLELSRETSARDLAAFLQEADNFAQFSELPLRLRTAILLACQKLEDLAKPQPEIVRVLRVLEYIGERAWVERTLANNAVKGERRLNEHNVIREATIGTYPEILDRDIL